jgi:hypothetical protein
MSPLLLAQLIAQLGTVGIPLITKLVSDINAGKTATTVTPDDLAELARLSALSAESIYQRLGIMPPPDAEVPKPAGT